MWLALDVNNLAWRSHHKLSDVRRKGLSEGVTFGIFRNLNLLNRQFHPEGFALAFDGLGSLRQKVYSRYRSHRKDKAQETEVSRKMVNRQLLCLRQELLPRIGFQNMFCQDGYEGDDVLGSLVQDTTKSWILVSSDKDLYQLLCPTVEIWNFKRLYTHRHFIQEYGIYPKQWPLVKALAGCRTDSIPGVKNVGEITALKYLKGKLPEGSVFTKRIVKHDPDNLKRDLSLTTIPFPGVKSFQVSKDTLDSQEWDKILTEYDFEILCGTCPEPSERGHTAPYPRRSRQEIP